MPLSILFLYGACIINLTKHKRPEVTTPLHLGGERVLWDWALLALPKDKGIKSTVKTVDEEPSRFTRRFWAGNCCLRHPFNFALKPRQEGA